MPYADLELSLHRRDGESYEVDVRIAMPDSDADVRPLGDHEALVRFDRSQLLQSALDPAGYGALLTQSLLADARLAQALAQARAAAASQDIPLRLRLLIGPSAPELHDLRWETLQSFEGPAPLLTGENIVFSRYLASTDWRPVNLRPRRQLRALVLVANPAQLRTYDLAVVDVPGEVARARQGLGDIPTAVLDSGGQATLDRLVSQLRDGYDILYLVAHGRLVDGQPWLWLEDGAGNAQRVSGRDLAQRLQELRQPPRLVVLASCQSAGAGEAAPTPGPGSGALAALGPDLAAVGIPAVVAMQGNVSMETIARFMPVFFAELLRDGIVDRALAAARGAVRDRPDWWMPVLFLRLKSGRIWYTPGFGEEREDLRQWPALVSNIQHDQCTPIIGPGLYETLLGSRKEIARRWAEAYHFPMAPYAREDLPQVAQYLAVDQQWMFPRSELAQYLRGELLQRFDEEAREALDGAGLDQLITALGQQRRAADQAEPHAVLAGLPLPLYITTDPSSLLEDALRRAGKEPVVELCRWNEQTEWLESIYDAEPGYEPTVQRPLVFHLYGQISVPDSVVITENDYFDYLIGVTSKKELIPPRVRSRLVNTGLLFLGFRLDEWDFRVLFRSIMSQEGRTMRRRYAHIAAQVDPEGSAISDARRAREYLETYFESEAISIYWGSAADFLAELQRHMQES